MSNPISPPNADQSTVVLPSEKVLYKLLSARRRREALYQLNEVEGGMGLADLARRMALEEVGSESDSEAAVVRRVHVSLHHVHVPKLAAANAVAFDRAARTLSLTETGRAILDGLEEVADRDGRSGASRP